ncbi:hypothetical protein M408DRAFT_104022 [Serendipita vermifera MAFF 305830]|uniref:Uncharacterized protein n=1 Tax=Serendipita vermifera MAFF 305830 TaxID=933852 RepID=A0A0C2W4M7_SERVB|nr:hypothetical protein M408DRAFT_104022 [Serendipita vermifera MAFF 305830]
MRVFDVPWPLRTGVLGLVRCCRAGELKAANECITEWFSFVHVQHKQSIHENCPQLTESIALREFSRRSLQK